MVNQPTAVVTGAGSGIGRQTGIQLAAQGYHLALVGRRPEKLEQTALLAAEYTKHDIAIENIAADLCDSETARAVITRAVERFGRIDALTNVAGYAPLMPIEQVTPDVWQQVVDTNLSCIVNLTAAAWPIMSQQNGGIIVNVSSMASIDPFPGLAVYAAAKAAVNMFTRCTAQEGEGVGIRSVAVAPGAVETPMLRSLFDESVIPRDRTLDPKIVAQTIVDCVTGNRTFEPGETIFLPSP